MLSLFIFNSITRLFHEKCVKSNLVLKDCNWEIIFLYISQLLPGGVGLRVHKAVCVCVDFPTMISTRLPFHTYELQLTDDFLRI